MPAVAAAAKAVGAPAAEAREAVEVVEAEGSKTWTLPTTRTTAASTFPRSR